MTDDVIANGLERAADAPAFEQLVFSGGGTRCFWHGGFLKVACNPLRLDPVRVTGASGGALSAACFIGRREDKLLKVMGAAFEDLDANVSQSLKELQEDGLTPHQRIYREVVSEVLDRDAIEAIAEGPSFQVLIAHPPTETLPKWSTFPLMTAYLLDLAIRSTPHVEYPEKLGADKTLVDARQAARDGRLIDLICCAAVIPPVFNVEGWNGRKVIDGGMTSKAPMPKPDIGRTLIPQSAEGSTAPLRPALEGGAGRQDRFHQSSKDRGDMGGWRGGCEKFPGERRWCNALGLVSRPSGPYRSLQAVRWLESGFEQRTAERGETIAREPSASGS